MGGDEESAIDVLSGLDPRGVLTGALHGGTTGKPGRKEGLVERDQILVELDTGSEGQLVNKDVEVLCIVTHNEVHSMRQDGRSLG